MSDQCTREISAELTQLRGELGRLAESVAHLVKSQVEVVVATVRAQTSSQEIEATIERNPLTAILVAAGIGLLLGMVSSR